MNMEVNMIDTSDIRELTAEDFAKARKNPYAEKINKHGFTVFVTEHFSPDDVTDIRNGKYPQFFKLDEEELEALREYKSRALNVDAHVQSF